MVMVSFNWELRGGRMPGVYCACIKFGGGGKSDVYRTKRVCVCVCVCVGGGGVPLHIKLWYIYQHKDMLH